MTKKDLSFCFFFFWTSIMWLHTLGLPSPRLRIHSSLKPQLIAQACFTFPSFFFLHFQSCFPFLRTLLPAKSMQVMHFNGCWAPVISPPCLLSWLQRKKKTLGAEDIPVYALSLYLVLQCLTQLGEKSKIFSKRTLRLKTKHKFSFYLPEKKCLKCPNTWEMWKQENVWWCHDHCQELLLNSGTSGAFANLKVEMGKRLLWYEVKDNWL